MKTLLVSAVFLLLTYTMTSAQDLQDRTVFGQDGSVQLSDETLRLLSDAKYRTEVYPDVYRLDQIPELLDAKNLMLALWTLINVFPDDNKQVGTIAAILALKGVRARHYLDAFYMYAFADPEIFHFGEEGAYVENPLRMETKLESCKTLAVYTEKYLKTQDSNE